MAFAPLHVSLEYFPVRKDKDSFSLHLPPGKAALIPGAILEHDDPMPVKGILLEFSAVL